MSDQFQTLAIGSCNMLQSLCRTLYSHRVPCFQTMSDQIIKHFALAHTKCYKRYVEPNISSSFPHVLFVFKLNLNFYFSSLALRLTPHGKCKKEYTPCIIFCIFHAKDNTCKRYYMYKISMQMILHVDNITCKRYNMQKILHVNDVTCK